MPAHTPHIDKARNTWQVILNPVSGKAKGLKKWPEIERRLGELQIPFEQVTTQHPGHSKDLIQEALAAGQRRFILVGGDGTHFEAIDAICQQGAVSPNDITLACLPAGTGNDWARTIYPGARYRHILEAIKQGKTFQHDIGWVRYTNLEGRESLHYFLNIAGLGFDAFVAAHYLNSQKHLGAWDYLSGLLRGLISYQPGTATIRTGDKTFEGKAFILAAGICKYFGGGMKITPHAEPGDGLFDVTMVSDISKLKVVSQLPRIYKGTFISLPEVQTFRTDHLRIEATEPVFLQVDGELLGSTPVEMGIISPGIQVIRLSDKQD